MRDREAAADPAPGIAQRLSGIVVAERPWGRFERLCLDERVTVKIITISPGCRLSLQVHARRDEMWQPLDVPMAVQVGEQSWTAQVGERVHVPRGVQHRLGNPGTEPGRVLELAFGDFDECDIERLQDDYAR